MKLQKKLSKGQVYDVRREFSNRVSEYIVRVPERGKQFLKLFGEWYVKQPATSRQERLAEKIVTQAGKQDMVYYTFLRIILDDNPSGEIAYGRLMGKIDGYHRNLPEAFKIS